MKFINNAIVHTYLAQSPYLLYFWIVINTRFPVYLLLTNKRGFKHTSRVVSMHNIIRLTYLITILTLILSTAVFGQVKVNEPSIINYRNLNPDSLSKYQELSKEFLSTPLPRIRKNSLKMNCFMKRDQTLHVT
jgi:hypothetical protein